MLHCVDGIGQMSGAWFPHAWHSEQEFKLGFIRPENPVFHGLKVLACAFY